MPVASPMTCPSSSCAPGHVLLGIVRPDGTVAGVRPALVVDEEFVRLAQRHDVPPEARMRFAGECVESACGHWAEGRCAVADLVAPAGTGRAEDGLAPCPVRSSCRWWHQAGARACGACPTVVHTRRPAVGSELPSVP